jgi:hypothetical protein
MAFYGAAKKLRRKLASFDNIDLPALFEQALSLTI